MILGVLIKDYTILLLLLIIIRNKYLGVIVHII